MFGLVRLFTRIFIFSLKVSEKSNETIKVTKGVFNKSKFEAGEKFKPLPKRPFALWIKWSGDDYNAMDGKGFRDSRVCRCFFPAPRLWVFPPSLSPPKKGVDEEGSERPSSLEDGGARSARSKGNNQTLTLPLGLRPPSCDEQLIKKIIFTIHQLHTITRWKTLRNSSRKPTWGEAYPYSQGDRPFHPSPPSLAVKHLVVAEALPHYSVCHKERCAKPYPLAKLRSRGELAPFCFKS